MSDENVFLDAEYARFYDWMCAAQEDDIPFYQRQAQRTGGPILEVGCGSGRLAIPLARAGFEVVGLDFSEQMLQHARDRVAREPPDVRGRITLVRGDMREFDLGRQFGSVFVPNSSIFHVESRYSLSPCFRALFHHTRPGGRTVLDCVAPERMANRQVGEVKTVRRAVNPQTGLDTVELSRCVSINWVTQVALIEHTFVEIDDEEEKKHTFRQEYRWLDEQEGVELLRHVDFPEVETLGDFDGSGYTEDSPRLILLAHRLERDIR